MPVRKANAVWEGNLPSGKGTISFGSGAFEGAYSFGSRFEGASGTNPEELIAAAHAGCFSMALSHGLAVGGHKPKRVQTNAKVHLEGRAFCLFQQTNQVEFDQPVIIEQGVQRKDRRCSRC